MSMNDTISDLLTRIRNGQMSNKKSISAPYSKMKESICKVMLDEVTLMVIVAMKVKSGHLLWN